MINNILERYFMDPHINEMFCMYVRIAARLWMNKIVIYQFFFIIDTTIERDAASRKWICNVCARAHMCACTFRLTNVSFGFVFCFFIIHSNITLISKYILVQRFYMDHQDRNHVQIIWNEILNYTQQHNWLSYKP